MIGTKHGSVRPILLITGSILLLSAAFAYADSQYLLQTINGRGYRVPISMTGTVYEYNICRQVHNKSVDHDAFIPTNNAAEWQSVIDHPGQYLDVSSCNSANNQLDWTVANNGEATCTFGIWASSAIFQNKGSTPITLALVSGSHTGMGGNASYTQSITIPAYTTKTSQIVSVADAGATVTTPYFCSHYMDRIDTINYTYTDPTTGPQSLVFVIEYQQ